MIRLILYIFILKIIAIDFVDLNVFLFAFGNVIKFLLGNLKLDDNQKERKKNKKKKFL
jgi:hypothetical protein